MEDEAEADFDDEVGGLSPKLAEQRPGHVLSRDLETMKDQLSSTFGEEGLGTRDAYLGFTERQDGLGWR